MGTLSERRARRVLAFRRRMAEHLRKEARCPACAKVRRLAEAWARTTQPAVWEIIDPRPPNAIPPCDAHWRLRIKITE